MPKIRQFGSYLTQGGDLLFLKKGASKDILIIMRAVPQSWGTSNITFVTDRAGDIEISFWEYSNSKNAHL